MKCQVLNVGVKAVSRRALFLFSVPVGEGRWLDVSVWLDHLFCECWRWSQPFSFCVHQIILRWASKFPVLPWLWHLFWLKQPWTLHAETPRESLRRRLRKVAVSFQRLAAMDRFNLSFVPCYLALPSYQRDSVCCVRSTLCCHWSFVWMFRVACLYGVTEMRWVASDKNGRGTEWDRLILLGPVVTFYRACSCLIVTLCLPHCLCKAFPVVY